KLRSKPFGGRYQVKDVDRPADFYSTQLGFQLDRKNSPAFAQVSIGNRQGPGWRNRVVLEVAYLPHGSRNLKTAGLHFRNEMETGPGGKEILLGPIGSFRSNSDECRLPASCCSPARRRPRSATDIPRAYTVRAQPAAIQRCSIQVVAC